MGRTGEGFGRYLQKLAIIFAEYFWDWWKYGWDMTDTRDIRG
jgi:hypothetical protein